MRRPSARRRRRAAFTLMEVLLVVAILLILGSIVVVSFSGIMTTAEEDTTKANIEAIANGVKTYYAQHRKPPDTLAALIQDPGNTTRKWRPILDSQELPRDAWNREIAYEYDEASAQFTLTSSGANLQDPNDDISVTKRF